MLFIRDVNSRLQFLWGLFGSILFLVLLGYSVRAEAPSTYYIDGCKGTDKDNGMSKETAWKTISRVNDGDLSTGDDVRFKRGCEYSDAPLKLDWSGTPQNRVIIGTYGAGEKPYFAYPGHAPVRSWGGRTAKAHITLQNLQIHVSKGSGIEIGSDNGFFQDIRIRRVDITGAKGVNNGILLQTIDHYKVSHCTIQNIPNCGIAIIGTSDHPIKNGAIRNNVIHDIWNNDGITLHKGGGGEDIGSNHLVEENELYDCEEQGLDITSGTNIRAIDNETYKNGDSGVLVAHQTSKVLLHRHYSHNENGMGIIIGPSSKVRLSSSVIENPSYHPLRINGATNAEIYHITVAIGPATEGSAIDIEGDSSGITFQNNVIASMVAEKPGHFVRFLSGNTAANTETNLSNNLWWRPDSDVRFYDEKEGSMSFDEFRATYKQGKGSLLADPLFKSTETVSLRPSKHSPAVEAGVHVDVEVDIEGNPFSRGTRPTIGALSAD